MQAQKEDPGGFFGGVIRYIAAQVLVSSRSHC
jgi:hypothetical protein